jgi:hypothetical protein
MIAVGCNDPYARVYDRRMIKMRSINANRNGHGGSCAKNSQKYIFLSILSEFLVVGISQKKQY